MHDFNYRKFILILICCALVVWAGNFYYKNLRGVAPAFTPAPALNTTNLPFVIPDGFSISVYAKDIPNARVLAWDSFGNLLVSSPATGKVFSVSPTGETSVVIDGLNKPHGIAFHDGKLFLAETDAVAAYDYGGKAINRKKIIDLPGGGNHFSRTIGFGSDGKLYISVGSSCNVCYENDQRRAKILITNPDGSDLKPFAHGLRNSVFFTWRPSTQEMWATEMGRDLLGDDLPPDEVNIIRSKGTRHYGWPSCYGKQIADRNYIKNTNQYHISPEGFCLSLTEPSLIDLPAHSAPLGLAFIPESWPEEYRGDLLVSYHGSWNRTEPTGYKVVRFDLDENGNSKGESDFLSGFLKGDSAFGRPVDLLFDAEGNLFISDDKAGAVYKVSQR